MIVPSHIPLSIPIPTYFIHGPKCAALVGATVYMSKPALGGGPQNPEALGV